MKKLIVATIIIIFLSGCIQRESGPTPTESIPTITEHQPQTTEISGEIFEKDIQKRDIELAKENLSQTLSVSINEIKLQKIQEATWPNSSLGYPKPDEAYLPVEVKGYKIFLVYQDKIYEYHGDERRIVPPPDLERNKQ